MAFDFTPELTEKDWEQLNDFRLKRLQASFSVLESCKLQLSCLTNDLLLICDRDTWNDLQDDLVDVRMASWEIVGASNLSIFADGHLVYCAMTQLSETLSTIEPTLESTALRLDSSMVTATQAHATETATPVKAPTIDAGANALPAFIDLMPLATKAGIPVERIAAEINQLGGAAGIDRTGAFITTDKDQRAWVKGYLQRLEADFLVPAPTASPEPEMAKPKAKRTRTDASQRNGQATTVEVSEPKAAKTPGKFKDFHKAQSYAVTIGRFLDAQGWDETNPLRAQVFEGIAALSDSAMPSAKSTALAERSLHKILSKYPASSRAAACKGLIRVAKETIGASSGKAEPALESTEV